VSTEASGTALLVLDAQSVIVEPAPESFFAAVRRALNAAHEAGIQVIYIRVELRPGQAGVSPRNKRLTRLQPILQQGAEGLEIHPSLTPREQDIVLNKHRVSSFVGSGLDVVLTSLEITHLVLAGVSTSTAVLGTAMAAADMDFGLVILSDACFDTRTATHPNSWTMSSRRWRRCCPRTSGPPHSRHNQQATCHTMAHQGRLENT
jgi:nicotinamidase-related amidase